jgi:thymidylate kinase
MNIYFTGIDGSGKSSIIKYLCQSTTIEFKNSEVIFARYSPKIVRFFTKFFMKNVVNITDDHSRLTASDYSKWSIFKKKLTRNRIFINVFYFIQTVDYTLQIKKIIRKLKQNTDSIIILDRFVLDFIVDQSVNYGDISKKKLTRHLLKKIKYFDKIFYLTVPNEIAFKRKNDIPSMQYLTDRNSYYRSYIDSIPNINIVENSGQIETTVQYIMEEIDKEKNECTTATGKIFKLKN